jgi:hypothetical protein
MGNSLKITISDAPTSEVIHRFHNFGEDVYRALHETCSVSIEEIDASINSFIIRDIRRNDLGTITQVIKRELKRHHFDQTATLTRL